jgi:DNA recombination protein Rad52
MAFSEKQVTELRRNLDDAVVHTREVQGKTLSYIEGWHAIAEANRIFGFDGWNRETVESKCVQARESRGLFHAVYLAKVRITVRAKNNDVIREGFGTGEADGASLGAAHEKALKTAETDATKRALATFGKPFGLSLYVSSRIVQGEAISTR